MFERFSEPGRRAIVLAQEEAVSLGHDVLDAEHLLLGLLDEGEGVAARALASLDVTVEDVRERVRSRLLPAAGEPPSLPPFADAAKKALELALREAFELRHEHIGTEHLLLGLVRDPDSGAAQILERLGATPAAVRARVGQLLSG